MNFYRDFAQQRLATMEEHLVAAAEQLDVSDDDEIAADRVLAHIAQLSCQADLVKGLMVTKAASEVYKIGQTYQVIDAASQLDYQAEGDGIADVVAGSAGDEFLNYSPAPLGMGHGYTHPVYPRVIGRVPIRHIHRLGPPGLFNGCLYRHGKESLYSCRTKGFPSRTYLYRPDEDMLFSDPKELRAPDALEYPSAEDVRIFGHKDGTYLSFTSAGQTGTGWLCRMLLAKVGGNRDLEWVHPLESPLSAPIEKNWVFFSYGGLLFCVYYPAPHVVYEVAVDKARPVLGQRFEATNWRAAEFMDNARGGASPVRVGDEFYHWYHTQHRVGRGVSYQVGLYTFKAQPPFDLARIVKGPVLSMVPSKRDLDVVFPTGAHFEKGTWTLSCGVQDHETLAISLDGTDIDKLLEKVEG